MRKDRWIQFGCALATVCIVSGSSALVKAGETLDVESAMAGAALSLNNYFASSINPEEELRAFLDSDMIRQIPLDTDEEPEDPEEETQDPAEEDSEGSEESEDSEDPKEEEPTQAPEDPGVGEPTQAPEDSEVGEPEDEPEDPEEEEPEEEPTEPETEAPKSSPYANIAVSHVRSGSYVNVRTEPNTTSDKLGKLYSDCAATILDTVEGEDGLWYEIQSGSVRGFIKAEYFLTGDEAEARAIEIGKLEGKVNTNGLRLRTQPNLDSKILTLLYSGEKYVVVEEGAEWVKIMVDDDLEGYVYREMIDISLKFDTAISLEEERRQKEEEARKKREAEEAARRLEEARKAAEEEAKRREEEAKRQEEENKKEENDSSSSSGSSQVSSASRDALVAYAKQWVGVSPYVYGGTSLQSGIDCSAFTQACYKNALGMSIPRTSRSQASSCTKISEGDLKPGDLVFYNDGSGTINHVAMYIGGGKVVHASNAKLGTIISNMKYREPCMYGRFIK